MSVSAGKAEGRIIVCVTVTTAPVAPLDVEEELIPPLSEGTNGMIPPEVELDVRSPWAPVAAINDRAFA